MKNLEFRLGADCSIMVCYEIDINNVSHISWTVDHGNRGDVNHFPKQISFGSRDNDRGSTPRLPQKDLFFLRDAHRKSFA
jgi:hypothetical protein